MVKISEFSEEDVKRFMQSKLFKKWDAYRSLAKGISTLKEDNVIYRQLLDGVTRRVGKLSQDSVEKVLTAFVEEVGEHIELVEEDRDVPDS